VYYQKTAVFDTYMWVLQIYGAFRVSTVTVYEIL